MVTARCRRHQWPGVVSLFHGPAGPGLQRACQFAAFELRPSGRQLLQQGQPLALGARALDVLIALVAKPGELLSKGALLDAAWPGLVVEEANVHVQISHLRKLLGKDAIATVGGLGYRFAWPVQELGPPPRSAPDAPAASATDPAGTSPKPTHNLPPPRTSFVGRQALLLWARKQLQQTRLLTLTGLGGMGKTRLALQLAANLAAGQTADGKPEPAFQGCADGICFVDLAPMQDSAELPRVIARALGVAQGGSAPAAALWSAVLQHLQARQLLLVIDNCEQLQPLGAARQDHRPMLAELLSAAPRVSLLATSRQALMLPGERVLSVQPMQAPELPAGRQAQPVAAQADAAIDPGIAENEAVQLFVQRAQAETPGFELEPHTAPLVADICRRLDGIPLALELAAARIKVLSVRQLHALLAQRFALLTQGTQVASRHQTLHEVLRWSVEHLPLQEQRLLSALSVCVGGFDLDLACALVQAPHQSVAVLDSLTLLADSALIHVTQRAETARYGMLETVREYLLNQADQAEQAPRAAFASDIDVPLPLAPPASMQVLKARHFSYLHALAHQAEQHPYGPEHKRWEARLDTERDNLLQALAWGLQHASPGAAMDMAAALKQFWFATGLLEPGLKATEAALARAALAAQPEHTRPEVALTAAMAGPVSMPVSVPVSVPAARALRLAAQLCLFMGAFEPGAVHARAALRQAEALGDETGAAVALCLAGRMAIKSGEPAMGEQWLQDSLRRARDAGALPAVSDALNALAFMAIERDDMDAAEAFFKEGLQVSLQRGSELGSLIEHLNLAWVAVMKVPGPSGACGASGASVVSGASQAQDQLRIQGLALAQQRLQGVCKTLRQMPHRYVSQEFIDVCASLAVRAGQWPLAVKLHAASTAQRALMHLPLTSNQAQRRQAEMADALAELGAAGFESASSEGSVISHETVLDTLGHWLDRPGLNAP